MPYTVWKKGAKIGETRFELRPAPRKLAGVFHPTASGISVLPAITAMGPALFDFGRMCRAQGIDVDDTRPEAGRAALDAFADTPEGKRIQNAASHIADLELRDPSGQTLVWESILISDMTALAELASKHRHDAGDQLRKLPGDPIRFLISATLAEELESPPITFGAAELEVC